MPRIRDIRIQGAFPVLSRAVTNTMSVVVGDVWNPEQLEEQIPRIAELFRKQGFDVPEIQILSQAETPKGPYLVLVDIQPGPYTPIQGVELDGAGLLSTSRLKIRLVTWQRSLLWGSANRLIAEDVQKDIRTLIEFYRREMFLDITVQHRIEPVPESEKVKVVFVIQEGARYRLEWSGNSGLSASRLSEDLTFLKKAPVGKPAIRQSTRNLERHYRQAGYWNTQVEIREVEAGFRDTPEKRIEIDIHEGPRTRVKEITFSGNAHISDSVLKEAMLTRLPGFFHKGPLDPEILEEDMRAIRSLYLSRGFLNSAAAYQIEFDPDREAARIHVIVEEGPQTRVGDVGISGLSAISEDQARSVMKLRPGDPFRPYMVESDRNALSELISETGRPRVQIQETVDLSPESNRAGIRYEVREGPEVETGQIRFAGNFRTRESVLENTIHLKTGEPFRLTELLKDQARLRDLGIFDSVRYELSGLAEGEPVVDVLITVEERKPYRMETGVGYETEKGTFFNTKLADINFMGSDIDAWIAGEISEIGYDFSSDITDPTLFDTRFSGAFGVYAEEVSEFNKAYGTRSVGATASIRRKFNPVWETGLIFLLENRSVFSVDGEPLVGVTDEFGQPLEESKRSFYSAAPFVQYDSRDSRIRPRSGGYVNVSVEPVRGIDSDLDHFMRYKGDFRYLISPFSRLTLATMLKAGYIRPMNDSDRVSTDQLLFLGGASTVRGFSENLFRYSGQGDPVGGRFSVCGSLENRISLTGNLELALFIDAGRLSDFQEEGISEDIRFSAGFGLRYITPVGPMGVMYGHKLDPEPGESPGRFHIAIGYTF